MVKKKQYQRDGRAPIPKKDITSKIMSHIRAKNTTPERIMRAALNKAGLVGYKLNFKRLPGRPDICYPSKRIAILIHGCYWHRCPQCKPSMPKTHLSFWKDKFKKNKARDKKKLALLHKLGWKSIVVWECEIKKSLSKAIKNIEKLYYRSTM